MSCLFSLTEHIYYLKLTGCESIHLECKKGALSSGQKDWIGSSERERERQTWANIIFFLFVSSFVNTIF